MTFTTTSAAAGAADTQSAAAWVPRDSGTAAAESRGGVEVGYGRRAVAALDADLSDLVRECQAPLTVRPAWLLATSITSGQLRPWVVVARDDFGTATGAVVLVDDVRDPRAVLTTLAGTDGGHRGAILAADPTVANALGVAVREALARQASPPTVVLGPLPADSEVVVAFSAGLAARVDEASPVPVIRCDAAAEPGYLAGGMRRTLRKAANRLRADGSTMTTRFTADATEIFALLPTLEQVHRQRDHANGRISDLDDAARHRAWRHRVRDLADAGVLELATLYIDGDLAAYTLGAVDGAVYRLLEGRFVTQWARYSPGRLLEAAVVERVLEDDALMTFDWMTAVAPESLLGRNAEDPMVLVQLGGDRA